MGTTLSTAPRSPIPGLSAAEIQSIPAHQGPPYLQGSLEDTPGCRWPLQTHGGHAGVLGTLWKSGPGTKPLPSGCSCPGAWQGPGLGHGNLGSREARGGGAREEPRGLNKKSLYNSAMSKVSIITIYSDKNIISFHINTTKKTPNQFSVLLPLLTD